LNTSIEKRRDREARRLAAESAAALNPKTPLKGSVVIVAESPMPKDQES
jgi:hypothetical protein